MPKGQLAAAHRAGAIPQIEPWPEEYPGIEDPPICRLSRSSCDSVYARLRGWLDCRLELARGDGSREQIGGRGFNIAEQIALSRRLNGRLNDSLCPI